MHRSAGFAFTPDGFDARFTRTTGPFATGPGLRGKLWFGTRDLIAAVGLGP